MPNQKTQIKKLFKMFPTLINIETFALLPEAYAPFDPLVDVVN